MQTDTITPEDTTTQTTLTCDAAGLLAAIKRVKVGAAKSTKATLPVLTGVKLDNGTLWTTDLKVFVSEKIESDGELSAVLPVVLAENILAKLAGCVTITAGGVKECPSCKGTGEAMKYATDESGAYSPSMHPCDTCKGSGIVPDDAVSLADSRRSYSLNAWSADEFPMVPTDTPTMHDVPAWRTAWNKTKIAISHDDTRPILSCVKVEDGALITTDSYRLARYETGATIPDSLIGRRACEIVAKLKGDVAYGVTTNETHCNRCGGTGHVTRADGVEGTCQDCHGGGKLDPHTRAVFTAGSTTVYARSESGQYPNWKQLVAERDSVVNIDKLELSEAIDAVSLMAQKNAPLRLSLNGRMSLDAITQDVGSAHEEIDYTGTLPARDDDSEPFCIGFNHAFMAEGIAALDEDTVHIGFDNPLRPAIIREGCYLYLLMPIRLSTR